MTAGELVRRSRGGRGEAVKDREMLVWVGRFRYTSVELLAMRFSVAAQNVRVRLKRLEAGGYVRLERRSRSEPWVVSLTGAGAAAIGEPARRAPRVDVHQAHELAIGWMCARLETSTAAADVRVVTEREMRRRHRADKRDGRMPRYRVDMYGPRGERSRWPDLVVERDGESPTAFEIEFSQKSDARLEAIIRAHHVGPTPEVVYLTHDPLLAGKLARVIRLERPSWARARVMVGAWPRATDEQRAAVTAAVTDVLGEDQQWCWPACWQHCWQDVQLPRGTAI